METPAIRSQHSLTYPSVAHCEHNDSILAISELVRALINATGGAVRPEAAIHRVCARRGSVFHVGLNSYDLGEYSKILLFAIGKAAPAMALAVSDLLHDLAVEQWIVTKSIHGRIPTSNYPHHVVHAMVTGHPTPDARSAEAGEQVCAALSDISAGTLVIACISGGASALMVAPHAGISLGSIQAINDALLRSGADIAELNNIRGRLDRLKAGGFARMSAPAPIIGLILSDVIGDPLDVIASGLTYLPESQRIQNFIIANNKLACEGAQNLLNRFIPNCAEIVTTTLSGEARMVGQVIIQDLMEQIVSTGGNMPLCRIYGGETTVTLRGIGKGGRNTELALAAALEIERLFARRLEAETITLIALATDGSDGPTDCAGAVVDASTVVRARNLGLHPQQFLDANDSYTFFEGLGDLIKTGPTGTNVADVTIAIYDPGNMLR